MGDRAAHLAYARDRLASLPDSRVLKHSRIEETAPLGPVPQGPYLKQMVLLETRLEPQVLLDHLHAIEAERARERRVRGGPRPLHLDILRDGGRVVRQPAVTLAHPGHEARALRLRDLAAL